MTTYLITGSSRGIGLELVRQLSLLPSTSHIFAVTRASPPAPLASLITNTSNKAKITNIIIPDQTSSSDVSAAVAEVSALLGSSKGLDVLVNNAGICPLTPEGMKSVSAAQMMEVFSTNVVSAQVVTSGFLPLLEIRKGRKTVINISSSMGSITLTKRFRDIPAHAYEISKAGMNMLTTRYAADFDKSAPGEWTFLAISPGWVKTDLGSQYADIEVEQSGKGILELFEKAGPDKSGKFFNVRVEGWEEGKGGRSVYAGEELPW